MIGGLSFIGQHLVQGLLLEGFKVKILDTRSACRNDDVTFIQGDFCDVGVLERAVSGVTIVFHCVSVCSSYGNKGFVERINVSGTLSLVSSSIRKGVRKLVLITSCALVSHLGTHTRFGRECQPYAKRPFDHSFQTKIDQERIILEANSPLLMTASVRIFAVFGEQPSLSVFPADNSIHGLTKYGVGSGMNRIDFTYVGNVVHGAILAAIHLYPSSPVCGQAYNITNGEPVSFNWMLSTLVEELGCESPRKRFPFCLMLGLAFLISILYSVLSICQLNFRTELTMSSVNAAGKDNYFSIEKSRAQLGYRPLYSLRQGLDLTIGRVERSCDENNS